MKVFITGATGFIGKHLIEKLDNEGVDITVNIHSTQEPSFSKSIKAYRLNENDIEKDIDFFKTQKFDGVFHLASLYLTNHTSKEAVKLIDTNVRFATHILECAAQAKTKWFINTGTFWQHFENSDYSPVNLYAASKQAFESIAQFYIDTNQIMFCTIKLSDTFGPNDTRTKIFNLWNKIAKTGELLEMSPGNQIIDISHIDDVVDAYYILAKHLFNNNKLITNGDFFSVQAMKTYSLKELADIYENVTGFNLNIKWAGRSYREREVMIPWKEGKQIPNWISKVSIEKGIKSISE